MVSREMAVSRHKGLPIEYDWTDLSSTSFFFSLKPLYNPDQNGSNAEVMYSPCAYINYYPFKSATETLIMGARHDDKEKRKAKIEKQAFKPNYNFSKKAIYVILECSECSELIEINMQ